MRFISLCLLFFSVAAVIDDDEGVLVLDDDNFDEAIAANSLILVEFYAPWCGHCKSLAPEYAKAAGILEAKLSPVKLAKVDATVATKIAGVHEIKGFPTLKFFRSGVASEYNGGRTAPEIVSWLDKKTGPAATTLSTLDELTNFQEANEVFALGVFFSTESAASKVFLEYAGGDDLIPYATTTSAEIQKKLGLTGDAVVILKDFDDKRADLVVSGDLDTATLKTFIISNSMPLVHEFSTENSKKIFASDVKKHVLFFTNKQEGSHAKVMTQMSEAAAGFKGQVLFVNVPSTESRVMEFFGFTLDSLPAMVVADMSGAGSMKKYEFKGEFTAVAVSAFVTDFLAGKLTPTLKSEEPSPEDTEGDVVILKGKSFNDLVVNNDKDVLVEFYAPWCGHCKQLAPKWDELGAKLKGVKSVTIAKMDATANEIDVPGVAVQGYPTIIYFKGNDKTNPVKYEEGREVDDFVKFLQKNAATPFTL